MIIKSLHLSRSFIILAMFFCLHFFVANVQAQEKNKTPFPVKYSSLADQQILLRTVTLAPVYDNLNGIYSGPIQKLLVDLLQSDKSWGFAEIVGHDSNKFIENYDLNPNDVLEVLSKTNAQGLLTAFITKGPRGLNAKLKLFTHDQGFLLAEESIDDFNAFEISKLRDQFVQMYQNLKNKLPYRGYVLSRRGLEVTISVGTVNGIKEGQELTLAQIIKVNRHPKLKFLVGVEKEIIAKVVVKKADTYLSFAQITFEKETGVVDIGAKVLPADFISYPAPELNKEGVVVGEHVDTAIKPYTPPSNVEEKPAAQTTPITAEESQTQERREELFNRHNTLGSVIGGANITQFSETNSLVNGSDASSKQSFAPGFFVGGQIYFYKDFFAQGYYSTSSFSVDNGLATSSPANLSVNYSKMTASVGYDYVFEGEEEDDDAIKFTGLLGLTNYNTNISNSSPVSLTSTQTSALTLTLKAAMPASKTMPLTIGGQFDLYSSPSFSESPVNSGSASTTMTAFGLFGVYKLNDNYNVRFDFSLANINNHFSGSATRSNPAGSGKIEIMTEQAGVEYLF